MVPTIFGFIVLAVCGYCLFTRSPLSLLIATMYFSLFGGSAALLIPPLANAPIQPVILALIFLILGVSLPGSNRSSQLPEAVSQSLSFLVFASYALIGAMILPRIFAGEFNLTPMKIKEFDALFAVYPVGFTSQNITQGVYIFSTFFAIAASYAASRKPGSAKHIINASIAILSIHLFFGITQVLFGHTPYKYFLDFFRNATYYQLDHVISGMVRINGILPEASAYAAYAFPWLVLMSELWLRKINPTMTGILALLTIFVLLISLSSSAVVGIAGYLAILIIRILCFPTSFPQKHILEITFLGLTLMGLGIVVLLSQPALMDFLSETLTDMTVNKGGSDSGQQRLFWAMQGITAFKETWGLGVGPGSFRSSSTFTAIIGSVGLIGTAAFAAFMYKVLQPFKRTTYYVNKSENANISAAFAWGAVAGMIPNAVSGATADPGIVFAIFSGVALSFRTMDKLQGKRTLHSYPTSSQKRL